ncbi:MAG: PHP domain-containing protein [Oscillospiraceae bacterium]|nr:PHP domain-containing protein [Oscillospiraceae bacterium]
MKADLHMHSTVSDGSDSIEQLIDQAEEKGLDAIAITDHDTLSHLQQMPASANISVIGGVELSASHRKTGTKAHVLGYGIKKPEIVMALTLPMLEARNRRSEEQAGILIKSGYDIDLSKIGRADGKYLYKQHIMDWLYKTGQVTELFGRFYENTFKNGGICDFDIEYIDVFDAVRAIKEAGGLAVLAHAGQQRNFWLVPDLCELGLDGLELNHPSNSAEDKRTISSLADCFGLFLTGGSDYHGRFGQEPFGVGDILSAASGAEVVNN